MSLRLPGIASRHLASATGGTSSPAPLSGLPRNVTGGFAARRTPTGPLARELQSTAAVPARMLPDEPVLDAQGNRKPRIVICGSGWGSMSLIKSLDHSKYEVCCVSPNASFNMTPLLASAAVGSLDFRHCMESVRGNGNTQLFHAWADGIDTASKSLLLTPAYPAPFRNAPAHSLAPPDAPSRIFPNAKGGYAETFTRPAHRRAIEDNTTPTTTTPEGRLEAAGTHHAWKPDEEGRQYVLKYDKLIISVGAYNRTFGTPGVKDHAWFLKDVQNARSIRWRILELFEMADNPAMTDEQRRQLLSFVTVGAGPTGVELSFELDNLIKTDLTRLYPKVAPLASVTVIDAASSILTSFDKSLADYARKKFYSDGIKMLFNRTVKRVEPGRLIVEPDGEIPFGLLVWSTGVTSTPLVKDTTCIMKDERNSFLMTDGKLRALAPPEAEGQEPKVIEDVYAIGDCGQIRGALLPATAQVAAQKAKHLAKVLNGKISEEADFKYKNMGAMAALGGTSAIVDSPKAKIHGRVAWLIWRSAYTVMSMSRRNQLQVPITWFLNRIFGRDLSRF